MSPVIEAFRGIAALLVLMHHYAYKLEVAYSTDLTWIHFFHSGVDLFFVITGYLFAPYLLGLSSIPVREFLIRRIFRLYPLYVSSLSVAFLFFLREKAGAVSALLQHLMFIQTLPIFSLQNAGFFSLVYWTLPVEVFFYLLVAVSLYSYRIQNSRNQRENSARSNLLFHGLVATAISALLMAWQFDSFSERWVIRQAQMPALLFQFWLGMAVYHLEKRKIQKRAMFYAIFLAGTAVLLAASLNYPLFLMSSISPRPFGIFNMFAAIGYALILTAALGLLSSRFERGSVKTRIANFIGAISYAVYLFHDWVLRFIEIAFNASAFIQVTSAATLTLVLSTFLHYSIEAPIRTYGRRLASVTTKKLEQQKCS